MLKQWVRLNGHFLAQELRRIAKLLDELAPGSPSAGIVYFQTKDGKVMSDFSVQDSSAPLSATVSFVDAKGAPTTADDVPQWSSSDDAVASVVASEDGMSATVTVGTPGAAVVSVSSTDTDGTVIEAAGTLTVTAGEAVAGSVDFAPTA